MAFPSFVRLKSVIRQSNVLGKYSSSLQNTAHGIQDHLQHGFWAQTRPNDICNSLLCVSYAYVVNDIGQWITFAAVMFEIWAFRPDCRSGAVSS